MQKKLNTWTLAGLMVGPILGSGILLLPPLAYARLGARSVWAWAGILVLGAAFAGIFIRMTLRTRSDAGIAELVARSWGRVWGELASNFLTGAVVFGAVPVFLTAGRIWPHELSFGWPPEALAGVFLAVSGALLWAGLTTVSRLSLVLSSTIAVLLVVSGMVGLATHPWILASPAGDLSGLGPTLLILFWAVVGWEVIGNYSNDVGRPEATIPRAGLIGVVAVSTVYLVTILALQTLAPSWTGPPTIATVLAPLFGPAAGVVAGILGGGLCLTSGLMFAGAVTRMTAQRAQKGTFPRWFAEQPGRPPRKAIAVQTTLSGLLLSAIALGWLSLEDLVSTSNLFFLGNALLGLAAAWKILPGAGNRVIVAFLAAILVALLAQGQLIGWLVFGAVAVGTAVQARMSSEPL